MSNLEQGFVVTGACWQPVLKVDSTSLHRAAQQLFCMTVIGKFI